LVHYVTEAIAQPPAARKLQTTQMAPPLRQSRPPTPRLKLLLDRFALCLSRSHRVDGLWVGGFLLDKHSLVFERVDAALSLIKTYDPLRYRRILCDVERIWVFLVPGGLGQFRRSLKSCDIDERFVLAETTRPEQIAAVIVHEATHARLFHCGIGYEAELRARVEAVCCRRELAFAARLPDGDQIRDEGERRLAGYPSEYWTAEAFSERFDKGSADALRYLGSSELFIRNAFRLRAVLMFIRRLINRLKQLLSKP
jgi:hypothetical protein